MKKPFLGRAGAVAFLLTLTLGGAPNLAADDYAVDPYHSGVIFRISHMGLTWIHGRFNEFSGSMTIDKADPTKSSFALEIKAKSVDTVVPKRDDHLRSPDFLDVEQFPSITFKSTAVKAVENGYEVTGDFTMHGKTKPITFKLQGGTTKEFKGMTRIGFYSDLKIKRSDFDVGSEKIKGLLGDDVLISIGLEGLKK